MRRFLPLFVPALLAACSLLPDRDGGISADACLPGRDPLFGEWEWVSSTGGFAGWTLTPESQGYTQSACFRSDSTFVFYKSDSLIAYGTFELRGTDHGRAIRYVPSMGNPLANGVGSQTVVVSDSTLHLIDPCCDMYHHIYRRR